MMADDAQDTLTLLRKFDKLIISKSATVADLVEQAIVASDIADESWETWPDAGPLEIMYHEMQVLINQVKSMQASITSIKHNSYENVTWTNTTDSTLKDQLGYFPYEYYWDPISHKAIKTTSGTGT